MEKGEQHKTRMSPEEIREPANQRRTDSRNREWADLPGPLLASIAQSLSCCIFDLISFRAVCRSWKSAAACATSSPFQLPWLIKNVRNKADPCFFMDVATDKIRQLPLLAGGKKSSVCGSNHGWLITTDLCSLTVELLHPLSGDRISLPPTHDERLWLEKAVLSSAPATGNSIVMAHGWIGFDSNRGLAFARVGDQRWTVIESDPPHDYQDLVHYNGQFYVVNCMGEVFAYNLSKWGSGLKAAMRKFSALPTRYPLLGDMAFGRLSNCYLVQVGADLFSVVKHMKSSDDFDETETGGEGVFKTSAFEIFKLDQQNRESDSQWVAVENLGDWSLFLGFTSCSAIPPSCQSKCRGNAVYFTYDMHCFPGCNDYGVLSLKDGSIERQIRFDGFLPTTLRPSCGAPFWFMPSLS